MEDYKGIYGRGYKDEVGNLYLLINDGLVVVREEFEDRRYNVGIIDNHQRETFHLSLLENVQLNEWRKFFLENITKKGINKLKHLFTEFELKVNLTF